MLLKLRPSIQNPAHAVKVQVNQLPLAQLESIFRLQELLKFPNLLNTVKLDLSPHPAMVPVTSKQLALSTMPMELQVDLVANV